MADVSANRPIFSRGSPVLDYWLVHAEGLIVQPLGARVEEVLVGAPVGHAVALIVRSRVTHRRKAISVESIAAVEPAAGRLLLDARDGTRLRLRTARLVREWVAAAGDNAARGRRLARANAAGAVHRTRAGTVVTLSWLRPRVSQVRATTARRSRLAIAQTARGVAWLVPRLGAAARTAGTATAQLTFAITALCARGGAHAARGLERATASAAARGRSLNASRARQDSEADD
jgi:hypothetical protein